MFVHTVIMVIEPHMKQGRQHKLISTIFLATSVTKKLDHNIMRVVRSSVYRRYTSSLNDLQSNLNKSMNKVSTGAAYETAADNPLAYYQGKKMDHLYQDAKSKKFYFR